MGIANGSRRPQAGVARLQRLQPESTPSGGGVPGAANTVIYVAKSGELGAVIERWGFGIMLRKLIITLATVVIGVATATPAYSQSASSATASAPSETVACPCRTNWNTPIERHPGPSRILFVRRDQVIPWLRRSGPAERSRGFNEQPPRRSGILPIFLYHLAARKLPVADAFIQPSGL